MIGNAADKPASIYKCDEWSATLIDLGSCVKVNSAESSDANAAEPAAAVTAVTAAAAVTAVTATAAGLPKDAGHQPQYHQLMAAAHS